MWCNIPRFLVNVFFFKCLYLWRDWHCTNRAQDVQIVSLVSIIYIRIIVLGTLIRVNVIQTIKKPLYKITAGFSMFFYDVKAHVEDFQIGFLLKYGTDHLLHSNYYCRDPTAFLISFLQCLLEEMKVLESKSNNIRAGCARIVALHHRPITRMQRLGGRHSCCCTSRAFDSRERAAEKSTGCFDSRW